MSQVTNVNADIKDQVRQFCSCPHCEIVWEHREWGSLKADWADARNRYGSWVKCGNCGTVSEPQSRENTGWFKRNFGNSWRVPVRMRDLPAQDVEVDR